MPTIHHTITNIGHRFGYQSGLDERSGQKSTLFQYGIVFRVCLMFSQISQNIKQRQVLTKKVFYKKGMSLLRNKDHLRQA